MSDRWHVLVEPGSFTLARRLPVRFDVVATVELPRMRKDRLARQVRQDMWRALQKLRGFSPVVRVTETEGGCQVTAGGSMDARTFPRAVIEERIATVLNDPERRARWSRWAAVVAVGLALSALTPDRVAADPVPVDVPSGQDVALVGVLLDDAPGSLWARFRFVAPGIGHGVSVDTAAADMDILCSHVAVPYLAHNAINPARIVISLSDREVPFGEKAPEATQYFEAYSYSDGTCIWEAF